MKNKLYLIPSFLGDESPNNVIPNQVIEIVEKTNYFIVEREKTFRKFVKKLIPSKKQQELIIFEIDKHSEDIVTTELKEFILSNLEKENIGLCSEAGTPCIADPGKDIVDFCNKNNIISTPLVGPSSILLSLMSSGFNGQNFTFNGYLPIDKKNRKNKLLDLERKVIRENQTQIFIETPYRNNNLFDDIVNICSKEIKMCIATDITLPTEIIQTKNISSWKKNKANFHKKPTIFLLGN